MLGLWILQARTGRYFYHYFLQGGSRQQWSPARSSFLHVDAKAPGRWVLNVNNSELLKEISSVFVTVEPSAGGKQPSGQKMLYAYLGEANHP